MKRDEIIKKAREVHGDLYEYEEFDERSTLAKMKITCKIHGVFEQAIYAHLRGQRCPKCVGARRNYTTEDFVREGKEKFGDKFDYSKVEYKGRRNKVCIMYDGFKTDENPNGEFWQLPFNHLNSRNGLPFMGERGKVYNKITNENKIKEKTKEFIEKASAVHKGKIIFDKTIYTGCHQKSIFICPIHGEFEATPNNILRGHGCPKCSHSVTMTNEELIEAAKKVHGDIYDYSKANIKRGDEKIRIICHNKDENGIEHGEFWQYISHHLHGHGCPKCSRNKRLTTEEFIEKAHAVHGDKYIYDKTIYTNKHTKVCITCRTHGDFLQMPNEHLHGQGCPFCHESKLEGEISKLLSDNQIEFERQKTFSKIKYKKTLPFDFYLPKHNIVIECQGEQHFYEDSFFNDGNRFLKDKIKYDGCINNGMKILYYTDINDYKDFINTLTYSNQNLFIDKQLLLNEIKKVE